MNAEENSYTTAKDRLKQIKKAFEQDNSLVKLVFERMPIGICITNAYRKFVQVNKAYCQIYEYEPKDLINQPFTMVVPEEYQEEQAQRHDDFIARKKEQQGECEVIDSNYNKFKILSNAAFIRDDETKEPLKMTFVVKLTNEEIAFNQMEETVKVLESKIAAQESAMSLTEHDIRKNLGTMVTVADILIKQNFSEQETKWLKIIKNTGYDTLDLLKATEDYIKMENGDYTLEKEPFDLLKLIRTIIKTFKDHTRSKKIKLTLRFNEQKIDSNTDGFWIEADLFYLKRMLRNLITNALEASPTGQAVYIDVFTTENPLKINIHNQGAIPKNIRESFFEKYITSGKSTGTGLGTYIAKLIAETHHANLCFKTSEEEGTTLSIALPTSLQTKNPDK